MSNSNELKVKLSWESDPSKLKEASDQIDKLKKKLQDLNEQKSSAQKGGASEGHLADLDKKIASVKKSLSLQELGKGEGPLADSFMKNLSRVTGGLDRGAVRNLSKGLGTAITQALEGALKESGMSLSKGDAKVVGQIKRNVAKQLNEQAHKPEERYSGPSAYRDRREEEWRQGLAKIESESVSTPEQQKAKKLKKIQDTLEQHSQGRDPDSDFVKGLHRAYNRAEFRIQNSPYYHPAGTQNQIIAHAERGFKNGFITKEERDRTIYQHFDPGRLKNHYTASAQEIADYVMGKGELKAPEGKHQERLEKLHQGIKDAFGLDDSKAAVVTRYADMIDKAAARQNPTKMRRGDAIKNLEIRAMTEEEENDTFVDPEGRTMRSAGFIRGADRGEGRFQSKRLIAGNGKAGIGTAMHELMHYMFDLVVPDHIKDQLLNQYLQTAKPEHQHLAGMRFGDYAAIDEQFSFGFQKWLHSGANRDLGTQHPELQPFLNYSKLMHGPGGPSDPYTTGAHPDFEFIPAQTGAYQQMFWGQRTPEDDYSNVPNRAANQPNKNDRRRKRRVIENAQRNVASPAPIKQFKFLRRTDDNTKNQGAEASSLGDQPYDKVIEQATAHVRSAGKITAKDLQDALGANADEAKFLLEDLQNRGVLIPNENGKNYMAVPTPSQPAKQPHRYAKNINGLLRRIAADQKAQEPAAPAPAAAAGGGGSEPPKQPPTATAAPQPEPEEPAEQVDPLLTRALQEIHSEGKGSVSFLQRRLKISGRRADEILQKLHKNGQVFRDHQGRYLPVRDEDPDLQRLIGEVDSSALGGGSRSSTGGKLPTWHQNRLTSYGTPPPAEEPANAGGPPPRVESEAMQKRRERFKFLYGEYSKLNAIYSESDINRIKGIDPDKQQQHTSAVADLNKLSKGLHMEAMMLGEEADRQTLSGHQKEYSTRLRHMKLLEDGTFGRYDKAVEQQDTLNSRINTGVNTQHLYGKNAVAGGAEMIRTQAKAFEDAINNANIAQKLSEKIYGTGSSEYRTASGHVENLNKQLKEFTKTVTGATHETDGFKNNINTLNKRVELQERREELHGQLNQEKDKDVRRNIANDLRTNAGQLRPLLDKESQRDLDKEQSRYNRKFGLQPDMTAFMLYGGGIALNTMARVGSMPYQQSMNEYKQYAEQYRTDPVLLNSEFRKNEAYKDLGSQLTSYENLKNNTAANLASSPIAGGVALGGQAVSSVAAPLGGLLQTLAMLQLSGNEMPWLGKLTGGLQKAGLIGTIMAAGGMVGALGASWISGKDPAKQLDMLINPTSTTADESEKQYGDMWRGFSGDKLDSARKLGNTGMDSIKRYEDAKSAYVSASYRFTSDEEWDKVKKDKEDAHKQLLEQADAIARISGQGGVSEEYRNDDAKLEGIIKQFATDVGAGKSEAVQKLQDALKKDPSIKLQAKQMNEKWNDFFVDMGRQTFQLNRDYSRQMEDIGISKQRLVEDTQISQNKLNISRTRSKEDYTWQGQSIDIQESRIKRDSGIQLTRLEEDTGRERLRLAQDDSKSRIRLEEDTNRQLFRLRRDAQISLTRTQEDVGISTSRAQEDAARNTSRLKEDSARERSRLTEDYQFNQQKSSLNFARSNQDLDTNLMDSVIGTMAPGLAGSKAFQMMKSFRDYAKQKSRLGQDYAMDRYEQNRNYSRGMQDINRNESRGLEDINRELSRSMQDAQKTLARAMQDYAKTIADGEADIKREHDRALTDLNTSFQRGNEDINRTETRGKQDISKQQSDSAVDIERQRLELQRNYNRTQEDLNLQQKEINLQFQRGMQDLNKQAKRATEDWQYSTDQLRIQTDRFIRDFGNEVQALWNQIQQQLKLPDMNQGGFNPSKMLGVPDGTTPGGPGNGTGTGTGSGNYPPGYGVNTPTGTGGSYPPGYGVNTPTNIGTPGGGNLPPGYGVNTPPGLGNNTNAGYQAPQINPGTGSGGNNTLTPVNPSNPGGGSTLIPAYAIGGKVDQDKVAQIHGGEWVVNPNAPDKHNQIKYALHALKDLGAYAGSFDTGGQMGNPFGEGVSIDQSGNPINTTRRDPFWDAVNAAANAAGVATQDPYNNPSFHPGSSSNWHNDAGQDLPVNYSPGQYSYNGTSTPFQIPGQVPAPVYNPGAGGDGGNHFDWANVASHPGVLGNMPAGFNPDAGAAPAPAPQQPAPDQPPPTVVDPRYLGQYGQHQQTSSGSAIDTYHIGGYDGGSHYGTGGGNDRHAYTYDPGTGNGYNYGSDAASMASSNSSGNFGGAGPLDGGATGGGPTTFMPLDPGNPYNGNYNILAPSATGGWYQIGGGRSVGGIVTPGDMASNPINARNAALGQQVIDAGEQYTAGNGKGFGFNDPVSGGSGLNMAIFGQGRGSRPKAPAYSYANAGGGGGWSAHASGGMFGGLDLLALQSKMYVGKLPTTPRQITYPGDPKYYADINKLMKKYGSMVGFDGTNMSYNSSMPSPFDVASGNFSFSSPYGNASGSYSPGHDSATVTIPSMNNSGNPFGGGGAFGGGISAMGVTPPSRGGIGDLNLHFNLSGSGGSELQGLLRQEAQMFARRLDTRLSSVTF